VRDLGPAEGLAADVPKEATLVMVLGPTKPFLPEEIASLQRFLDRGGRMYIALDPDGGVDMHELLAPTGLRFTMKTLANDQMFGRRTHTDADQINLVTGLFSSHPSVSTLSRQGTRAPVVFPGATALDRIPNSKPDFVIDFTVHAHYATFPDLNGDYKWEPGEDRRTWEVAAALAKTSPAKDEKGPPIEQRLFLVGDSDFLTDLAIHFGGNGLLALDPVRWLIGEESFAGEISTEADVPIAHTRKQDVAWFYSSTFAIPGLVIALGFVVTRKRRRARGAAVAPAPAVPVLADKGGAP